MSPRVSAVIPTRGRPELVVRALRSVLAQTFDDLEVIVVIDGPDPETRAALAAAADTRVRVVELPASVGGSDARNIGARNARGEWVAFLDDDDEWLRDKLATQLAAVDQATCTRPLICSQVLARSASGDSVWPERPPQPPYCEYLLMRTRLRFGEGLIQTSTIMVRRELLEQVPFRSGLAKYQDWDWILRCMQRTEVCIHFIPRPLAVWTLDCGQARVSRRNSWRTSLEWIRSVRAQVTRRAYGAFIATYVAPQAAAEGAWRALGLLVLEMCRIGLPRPLDVAVFIGAWLLPPRLRQGLRSAVLRRAGQP